MTQSAVAAATERGVRGIDRVLLVGGASRMPAVARRLSVELGVPVELTDPDLAVAKGAAIYGEKKSLERLVAADLVTRGQLVDGAAVDTAAATDLDAACRRLADAFGLSPQRVRRTVEVQVVNVVLARVRCAGAQSVRRAVAPSSSCTATTGCRSWSGARSARCATTRRR